MAAWPKYSCVLKCCTVNPNLLSDCWWTLCERRDNLFQLRTWDITNMELRSSARSYSRDESKWIRRVWPQQWVSENGYYSWYSKSNALINNILQQSQLLYSNINQYDKGRRESESLIKIQYPFESLVHTSVSYTTFFYWELMTVTEWRRQCTAIPGCCW